MAERYEERLVEMCIPHRWIARRLILSPFPPGACCYRPTVAAAVAFLALHYRPPRADLAWPECGA